jgi:hypothetical protein
MGQLKRLCKTQIKKIVRGSLRVLSFRAVVSSSKSYSELHEATVHACLPISWSPHFPVQKISGFEQASKSLEAKLRADFAPL